MIITIIAIYLLGTIITTMIASGRLKNRLQSESQSRKEDAIASVVGLAISWPIVALVGTPIYLASRIYKIAYMIGINGDPYSRRFHR
jgi:hypothetical protein